MKVFILALIALAFMGSVAHAQTPDIYLDKNADGAFTAGVDEDVTAQVLATGQLDTPHDVVMGGGLHVKNNPFHVHAKNVTVTGTVVAYLVASVNVDEQIRLTDRAYLVGYKDLRLLAGTGIFAQGGTLRSSDELVLEALAGDVTMTGTRLYGGGDGVSIGQFEGVKINTYASDSVVRFSQVLVSCRRGFANFHLEGTIIADHMSLYAFETSISARGMSERIDILNSLIRGYLRQTDPPTPGIGHDITVEPFGGGTRIIDLSGTRFYGMGTVHFPSDPSDLMQLDAADVFSL